MSPGAFVSPGALVSPPGASVSALVTTGAPVVVVVVVVMPILKCCVKVFGETFWFSRSRKVINPKNGGGGGKSASVATIITLL